MSIGLIGTKLGMTREFIKSGQSIPVTVIKIEKGRVLDVITKDKRGYSAVKVGFFKIKNSKLTKQMKGYFAKKNTEPKKVLKEFRIENNEQYKEGNELGLELLKDKVSPFGWIVVDDFNGRWSDQDLFYSEREDYADVVGTTPRVETEKKGVKPAVTDFLNNNLDWAAWTHKDYDPAILFRKSSYESVTLYNPASGEEHSMLRDAKIIMQIKKDALENNNIDIVYKKSKGEIDKNGNK